MRSFTLTMSCRVLVLAVALVGGCTRGVLSNPQRTDDAAGLVDGSLASPAASSAGAVSSATPADSPTGGEAFDGGVRATIESLGFQITTIHKEPRYAWRQVEKMHWQAVVGDRETALPAEARIEPKGCGEGMVLIEGGFLVDSKGRDDTDELMFLQNSACTQFLTSDRGHNALCDRFDRDKWLSLSARLDRKPVRFCMDRYEFPNLRGEYPLVVVTFSESEKLCARVGKRICTENEWTFACEGEEGRPFPTGYERDKSACNIGVLGPGPDPDTFRPRFLERTARGIDLSFRGKRSGESPRCVSPFGVEDMTGNVDEWTKSVRPYGYQMIMKGGHWGPGRQRCRPQTRGHGPFYIRYDQGFRCCSDARG